MSNLNKENSIDLQPQTNDKNDDNHNDPEIKNTVSNLEDINLTLVKQTNFLNKNEELVLHLHEPTSSISDTHLLKNKTESDNILNQNVNIKMDLNVDDNSNFSQINSRETNLTNLNTNNSNEQTLNSSSNENDTSIQSPQSLPPAYWEVPGTVPISAGTSTGPPPTYDEVVNPNVPPPTYQSLFGQVQNARKTAKTLPDLIKKLIIVALGTIGLTFLIAFTVLIPFTMILVGGSNLDNCKAERIPLFLLIGGITWLTKNLSNFFSQCSTVTIRSNTNTEANSNTNNNTCNRNYSNNLNFESSSCASNNRTNRSSRCVINLGNEQTNTNFLPNKSRRRNLLINCFILVWFLAGCVMVYRIYPPNYTDISSPNYCNKTVYFYAFWLLTSIFIIFGLFLSCICCVSITALFSSSSEIRI